MEQWVEKESFPRTVTTTRFHDQNLPFRVQPNQGVSAHSLAWNFNSRPQTFLLHCSLCLASISKWECCSQISCGLQLYPIFYWWVTRWQNALKVTPCAYLNYWLPRSHAFPSTNLEDQVAIPWWASGFPSQLHDFGFAFCKEQAGLRSRVLLFGSDCFHSQPPHHTLAWPLWWHWHYQSNMIKRFESVVQTTHFQSSVTTDFHNTLLC